MFLAEIRNSWPFEANAPKNLEDKEIFSEWIQEEDASSVWRVNIPPPMTGFTYLAFRFTNPESTDATFQLVHGLTDKRIFKWIEPMPAIHGAWTPLPFPIVSRVAALTEDGMDLLIKHKDSSWGKVELLAQQLDDLPAADGLTYAFVSTIPNKIVMVLTDKQMMYMPSEDRWPRPTKMLPPLSRVLDPFRAEWCDKAVYWNGIDLKRPF